MSKDAFLEHDSNFYGVIFSKIKKKNHVPVNTKYQQ